MQTGRQVYIINRIDYVDWCRFVYKFSFLSLSAMPVNTVPDNVKRNVRAVLLSKVGGVLVSDLVKDYKSLLKEPLKFKDLGFGTIKEFVEAMPEVCRSVFFMVEIQ